MRTIKEPRTNLIPRIPAWVLMIAPVLMGTSANAQTEPAWPQQFQVLQGESASFGFAVNQAGVIGVQVATQGAMAKVTLSGPAPQPIQQVGSGAVRLTYKVTPDEVQKSSIWVVRITEANPVPLPLNQSPRPVISGRVAVEHPPANPQLAAAEIQRLKAATAQRMQSQAQRRPADTVAPKRAGYASQVAAQQAAQKQQLVAIMRRAVPLRANQAGSGAPAPGIGRTAPSVRTTSSGGDQTAGSGAAPPPAAPQITYLSTNHGQPKDPILITGSGFGSTQGQVHFIINPGVDKIAPVDYWSDTQIMAYVPDVSGISGFSGQMYIQQTGGQKSALAGFQFNPTLDFAELRPTINGPDQRVDQTDLDIYESYAHTGAGDLFGHKADDLFYLTTTLKNGWVVDSVNVAVTFIYGNANAYTTEARVGTSSPYLKVHWWTDAFSSVYYTPVVTIRGPLGLPYR